MSTAVDVHALSGTGKPAVAGHPTPAPRQRVLHVINGEHYSGAERVQDLLALNLPENGFEVCLAALKSGEFAAARQSRETRLIELPMRHRFDFRAARALADAARDCQCDLLHAHTPRTAVVGRMAAERIGVPLVYHVHSPVSCDSTRRLQNWVNGRAENWATGGAAQLICVSPSLKEYMHRRGVPASRLVCIPNGVPHHPASTDRARPAGTWTLGVVALFRPRKGLEVLLEALAALRARGADVRLRAVGRFETPGYESAIMCSAERLELGDAIDWVGFTHDVPAELARCDLMVLPSLFGEGLPMVVLEALAAGLPVVASRVEGVPQAVVHRETGLLAEPGNVSQLVHVVEEFLSGRVDYELLSRQARRRHAERFSDRAMAADVAEVYRQVLAARLPAVAP